MWVVPKRSQIISFTTIGLICLIFVLNTSSNTVLASPSKSEVAGVAYPNLFVTKVVEKTEISLGESFVVTITIRNIGNTTAYNVTFIDDITSPWIFEVTGLTQLSYSWIEPGQTRIFSYIITTKSIGTFELNSANIYYYSSDVDPSEYKSISNALSIIVDDPPEDFSLANYNAALTFLLIIICLNAFLIFRIISPRFNRRSNDK